VRTIREEDGPIRSRRLERGAIANAPPVWVRQGIDLGKLVATQGLGTIVVIVTVGGSPGASTVGRYGSKKEKSQKKYGNRHTGSHCRGLLTGIH